MHFKRISNSLLISMVAIVSVVSVSNAALITVNNQSLNAYDIDKDSNANTFEDFYNYMGDIVDDGTLLPFSSNTGFEIPNQIVMMLVKKQNKFGLIGLISGRGGIGGGVTMSFQSSNPLSKFIDDPDEFNNGGYSTKSEIKWRYFKNRGDGFIFSGLNSELWNVDTKFSNFSSSLNGDIAVLSFDDNNSSSALIFDRNETLSFKSALQSAQIQINAPSITNLFLLLFGVFLVSNKFIKKRVSK